MSWLSILIRGLAMGAADAVPGVSGGTVAFLTGIYERLLAVLTSVTPDLWTAFRQNGLKEVWNRLDGGFVLPLMTGILMSLVTVAHLIKDWLEIVPERVWGFFFGLVIAMGLSLLSNLRATMQKTDWLWLFFGLILALSVGLQTPQSVSPEVWIWPFAGAIALSAMLLPGISGSFLLLLMGLYPALIDAISSFDITILGLFISGGVFGILLMAHVLKALLARYHNQVLSVLTGVVFGALVRVWPWQSLTADGSLVLMVPTANLLWIPLAFGISGFISALFMVRLADQNVVAAR